MRIKQLTKEQEDLIYQIRDFWNSKFFDYKQIDKEKVKKNIEIFYEKTGFNKPIIIYMSSPLAMQYCINILRDIFNSTNVSDNIWDNVWDNVRDNVWDNVRDNVRDNVSDNVWANVWDNKLTYYPTSNMGLAYDSYWCSFYDFFDKIGLNLKEKFPLFKNYLDFLDSNIYDSILLRKFAIVCELPEFVKREGNDNKMHCITGEAIRWKDGYKLYYLHGVNFSEELFLKITSENIDPKLILSLDNIEQRYASIKTIGMEKLLNHLDHVILDKTKRGNELILIKGLTDNPIYYCRYKCPSTDRIYMSAVPPEIGIDCNADKAMAWKFCLNFEEYESLAIEA